MFMNQTINSANASQILDTTMKLGAMIGGESLLTGTQQFDQTLNNTALLNGLAEYSALNKAKGMNNF